MLNVLLRFLAEDFSVIKIDENKIQVYAERNDVHGA